MRNKTNLTIIMKPTKLTDPLGFSIEKHNFKSDDVLRNQRDRIKRKAQLLRAMTLEGIDQTEVILTYQDDLELKRMRTRVIVTADDSIVLDHGNTLPIHCILDVEFIDA
ncbi:MAG: hypothetical protein RL204_34 [Bacteroidota bacterium]